MARIQFFNNSNQFGYFENYVGTFLATNSTATRLVLEDQYGMEVWIKGVALTYTAGVLTGGRVTGITLLSDTKEVLLAITQVSLFAPKVAPIIAGSESVAGLEDAFTRGNDVVIGSSRGEYLWSGAGNDVLIAGAGNDTLFGLSGDDTMTGGLGRDTFIFAAMPGQTTGNDIIADFVDVGIASRQDVIIVSRADYAAMTTQQIGGDAVLSFGASGNLTLLNYDLQNLGFDDFRFSLS